MVPSDLVRLLDLSQTCFLGSSLSKAAIADTYFCCHSASLFKATLTECCRRTEEYFHPDRDLALGRFCSVIVHYFSVVKS